MASLIADSLPRCAVVEADAIAAMIRSGAIGPVDEPAQEARAQLMLRARGACLLTTSFAEAGFFPVIDHVVADAAMLQAMLGWLAPAPLWLVTLAPDLATARRRNTQRPKAERIGYDLSSLLATLRTELSGPGWWFDTSDLDAAATAARILAEAPRRARIGAARER